MNKRFTKLIAALALLVFMTPSLAGWGQTRETTTGTLNMSESQTSPVTVNDVTFTWTSANIVTGGGNSSGFKANSNMTVTIPSGAILTKIEKTNGNNWGSGATISVYAGSDETGTNIASIVTGTHVYNISSNNTGTTYYFANSTGKNAWIKTLSITYEVSSGASTTVSIDATGITNTDVYTSNEAGSLSATVSANGETISGASVAWSSSNTDVATINENGEVTLVAAGTTTITAAYGGESGVYNPSSATYELAVTSSAPYVQPTTVEIIPNYTFWGKTAQFSGDTFDELSGSKDNVSLDWTRGSGSMYANQNAMRFYKDNTLTFTAPEGYEIKSIVLTVSGTYSDLTFAPTGFDNETTTWTGSSETVTMSRPSNASSYATISKFTITIGLPSTDPSITANNISIEYDATEGEIAYTVENPVDDATVVATATAEWLTIGTIGETVPFTCSANTETSARTATVTLNYVKNGETLATKDVTVTQAAAPVVYTTIPALFDAATSTSTPVTVNFGGWVVTGVNGSQSFVTDGTNGFIMYQSSHGFVVGNTLSGTVNCNLVLFNGSAEITGLTTTTEGLTVGENGSVTPVITTIDNLAAVNTGSVVTLNTLTYNGTVLSDGNNTISPYTSLYHEASFENGKTYNITGVFVQNNSAKRILPRSAEDIEEVVVTEPSINIDNATIEVAAEGGEGILTVQYENITEIVAEVYFCDAEGTEATYDWITAVIDTDNNVSWLVESNEGEARTAYFKVYALDDEATDVYSNLVTVNQAAPVTGDKYVKVASADDLTDGQYLIVYEEGSVAFNGGLETLDATSNTIEVTISNNEIAVAETTAAAEFTIDVTNGTLKSASGKYIGVSTNNNGLKQTDDASTYTNSFSIDESGNAVIAAVFEGSSMTLRYNSASNQNRFRYYTSGQKAIQLYKKAETTPTGNQLSITGYGEGSGNWYLVASPVSTTPEAAGMITDTEGANATPETATYDLYYYNHNAEDGLEWRNYRTQNFELTPGTGYLYANKNNVTLTFTGTAYEGDGSFNLVSGWNLMGNPFATTAYIGRNFYMMNPAGSELIACTTSNDPIEAMHAVFVEGGDEDQVTFSTTAPDAKSQIVAINVTKNRGTAIDRAIVRFDEGQQLPKFQLNPNNTKLYIAQGNKDYAIVRSAAQGEMPVSFRAAENGTYTLSIETENVEMDYLHLIDNLTGMDVDLLPLRKGGRGDSNNPQTASYTFEAKTSDYASRFRLVFSANSIDEQNAETFAYFNGSEWMVSNLGEATLQVVDVMGRVLSTETISGNAELSLDQPAGVYMLRLINGNDVKVQKVIVK